MNSRFSRLTVARCLAATGLMFLLAACGVPDDSSVRAELRDASSKSGLALIMARGSRIMVIPFDAPEAYFSIEFFEYRSGVGKAGSIISRARIDPLNGRNDLVISTVGGKALVEAQGSGNEFAAVALSEAAGRFTYLSGPPRVPKLGLYWTSFDFSHGGFIDASDGDNPQGDWSPDGRFVTYQKSGSVYIFDVTSGSSTRLVEGRDPTWSQSGDRISFRAPDGRASLVTVAGKSVAWPIRTYRPLSPIRWSPDGKYVLFPVDRPLHVPLIGTYYDLLVCRVSDGKAVSVRAFGALYPDFRGFYWIVDYRHFCADCGRGEPFN